MTGDEKHSENKRTKAANNGVSSLLGISLVPESILLEIFLRMPILSIMCCKCVCTAWYKLLRGSIFTKFYGKNSNSLHLILPHNREKETSMNRSFSFLEILGNGDFFGAKIEPKLPFEMSLESSLSIVGSCNSLLCLELKKNKLSTIYISNPIMGDCIALPQYGRIRNDITFHKFGFSPLTNRFKVMRILYRQRETGLSRGCAIFTIGVDKEWRTLMNISPWNVSEFNVLHLGSFHWIVRYKHRVGIHTFNLEKEKVGTISHPPGIKLQVDKHYLVVLRNHLSLVDRIFPSQVNIWRMEKYGDVGSWAKIFSLVPYFSSRKSLQFFEVIALLENGEILLVNQVDKSLVTYKCNENKYTRVGCSDMRDISPFTMMYTPSFLSLEEVINGRQKE